MLNACLLGVVFMLMPAIVFPGDLSVIEQNIKPGNIVIIGESHQRPESPMLIKQLVNATIARHGCLTVGLEINENQQPIIDAVVKGRAAVSEINIPPAIDHPGMRELIEYLTRLKSTTPCLRIEAIDANHDRDESMANRLSDFPTDKPILVLLGGLHTLKQVDWTIASGEPSVAEILAKRGFRVKSYPQRWLPEKCESEQGRASRFVKPTDPEALTILNESLISLLNARPHQSAIDAVDGFVVWECKR